MIIFLKVFLDDQSPGTKYNSSHLEQIQVGRLAPEKPFRVIQSSYCMEFPNSDEFAAVFRPYFLQLNFLACYDLKPTNLLRVQKM